jgi:hypothetical protein
MTAITYPREFASDSLFNSGPSTGQPTKIDPTAGAEAQGVVAGYPFAAAHHNFSLNKLSQVSRWSVEQALLDLEAVEPTDIENLDDTCVDGQGCAVADEIDRVLVIRGGPGGVFRAHGGGLVSVGTPAGATSPQSAALNPAGILGLAGSASGHIARSTDSGATWTHVSVNGSSGRDRIIFDSVSGLFIHNCVGGPNLVVTSPDLVALTNRALGLAMTAEDLAVNSSGRVLVLCDNTNLPAFATSTNGTTYADTGGTPPGMGDYGSICCNGTLFFWAGKNAAGTAISIQTSTTGTAWAEVGSIAAPGTILTGPSTIMACDVESGVLWCAVQVATLGYQLYASADSGATWIGPRAIGSPTPALSVAGGRLFIGSSGLPTLRSRNAVS